MVQSITTCAGLVPLLQVCTRVREQYGVGKGGRAGALERQVRSNAKDKSTMQQVLYVLADAQVAHAHVKVSTARRPAVFLL
jgi:hypothetical protein